MKRKPTRQEVYDMIFSNLMRVVNERGMSKAEIEEKFKKVDEEMEKKPKYPVGLNPSDIETGKRIRGAREEREMSLEQVAVLAEMPLERLIDIENGDAAEVDVAELFDIAFALDLLHDVASLLPPMNIGKNKK